LRAIVGSTRSRTRISTARSDHGASATRWSSDWCCAAVRSGASLPPMVRRVSGPRPKAARHRSPRTVGPGRHGPGPKPSRPHTFESVLACRSHREDPHLLPPVGIPTATASRQEETAGSPRQFATQ
jgi:hypothetical protein